MKNRSRRRILLFSGMVLFILAAVSIFGASLRSEMIRIRQREAENTLYYYQEKMILQLQGTMNEAKALAQTALVTDGDNTQWFERASELLLEREEVRFVGLFKDDVMVSAQPEELYGELNGRNLQDFSYAFTLAKVVKDLVVEGPRVLDFDADGEMVFLFLQPIVEDHAYLGEAVVALDWEYVLEQLGLEELSARGYDYELWRVEPQNGAKEVIAKNRDYVDFSRAKKTTFYLPSQWNLSVQPSAGWLSPVQKRGLGLACAALACLLIALAYLIYHNSNRKQAIRDLKFKDDATGLYNLNGFTTKLDRWLSDDRTPVMLFYFSFEDYSQAARMMGIKKETAFLQSIPGRLREYIRSPYLAGYLGSGNLILALRDDMDPIEQEEFAKGLSLELLLKVSTQQQKLFLLTRYQYARCQSGRRAEEEIEALIHAYYNKVAQESPIQRMTEKCEQLIEGNNDVIFDEYTDIEMNQLSKTFNRYRKQVEQLAYSDPMFNIGNRPKYFRDTDMLISYDSKRPFSLFCIDICDFSQYNELFSAEVGDEILHEVRRRLSRPFGSYLYRINGDVFLGILLSTEPANTFMANLQQILTIPVMVENRSIPLQVRLVACQYPAHGNTPVALLERLQSAMRFSKASGKNIVVYNDILDETLRTEADILHRLNDAIEQQTLEIWFQPMMQLASGQYKTVEALTRLPDGKGGYYPAGQVISLAERNGSVEALGDYVLTRACSYMHSHGDALGLERMSINLSVQQLVVGNSAEHLLKQIRAAGVDPHRIVLEITESILIQSIDHAAETLKELRRQGIHIALDDFGVGYSSLNYLSNLPVDIIKIDRSLTQQILTNKKQYTLLKSIVEMSMVNDLIVVAEGVEHEAEQKLISAAGVHYIQGYYYARPMRGEDLTSFLKNQQR